MDNLERFRNLHVAAQQLLVTLDAFSVETHPLKLAIDSFNRYLKHPPSSISAGKISRDAKVVLLADDYWPKQFSEFKADVLRFLDIDSETLEKWKELNSANVGEYSSAKDSTIIDFLQRVSSVLSRRFERLEEAIEAGGFAFSGIELPEEWKEKLNESFAHSPDWLDRMERNASFWFNYYHAWKDQFDAEIKGDDYLVGFDYEEFSRKLEVERRVAMNGLRSDISQDEVALKSHADLLLNMQQDQAIYRQQLDMENEHKKKRRLSQEAFDQWKAICVSFDGWAKRNVLGDDLPGYQSDTDFALNVQALLAATKARYGPKSIKKVAAFDAEVYRADKEDQQRFSHAIAVQWIIQLLNEVDDTDDALAAVVKSKAGLRTYDNFRLTVFGTRLEMAEKVIERGVVERFCGRCGEQMLVSRFRSDFCCQAEKTRLDKLKAFVSKYAKDSIKTRRMISSFSESWNEEFSKACLDFEDLGFESPTIPDREIGEVETFKRIKSLVQSVEKAILSLPRSITQGDGGAPATDADETQIPQKGVGGANAPISESGLKSCKPSERRAYYSFKLAEAKLQRRLEDRAAWEALKENDWSEDFTGELEGYQPSKYETWARQLRAARKATGEQKYAQRTRR